LIETAHLAQSEVVQMGEELIRNPCSPSTGAEKMALTDPLQWIIIAVAAAVFLIWGPKKIPELARSLGLARKQAQDVSQTVQDARTKLQNPEALLDSLTPKPEQSIQPLQQPQSSPPIASTAEKSGDGVLLDTARRLGISTAGKTRDQISQEMLAKVDPPATVKP
jgi:sec-independent protein translocase protein TatA